MARVVVLLLAQVATVFAGVGGGLKPVLGWSTWNSVRCNFTEANITANVDAMVALGLVELGFTGCHIVRGEGGRPLDTAAAEAMREG